MDLDEAIKRAVAAFYSKNNFAESYEKASGKKVRHSKEFFDKYEEDLRGRGKKKPKKVEEEVEGVEDAG